MASNCAEKEFNSGCDSLNEKIKEWLLWDKNSTTQSEILKLAEKSDWNVLKERLVNGRLTFGTAGLRGVMQAGFQSMNDLVVIQTAQGLLQYILHAFPSTEDREKGIVLGYDGRYNSKRFAELTAAVFLHEHIPVWLYSKMVATPFIPFAIVELNCMAGVMVTASHNPKEDNGYKVYWQNGAQIIAPHDKNIEKYILSNLEPLPTSWNLDILSTSTQLKDPVHLIPLYYEKLLANIPSKFIETHNTKSDLQFVYTAMHGVGYEYVEQGFAIVKLKPLIPVLEQRDADPDFPTVKFPNPEEGASSLELSIKLAESTGTNIILANDPDADRLACAERDISTDKWKVFTGNELGALLGWWSTYCFKHSERSATTNLSNCYMLASTVSSKILRAMARIDGFQFVETLTGFKWMGNKSVELLADGQDVLFAFEEAIGFMCSPTVLDKDGVSAACHLASLCCYLEQTEKVSLNEKLNEIYHKYGYHFTINSYFICYESKTIATIFERIRNYGGQMNGYPKAIGNGQYKIASIRDLTTGVDTSEPDGKATLPCSKSSQMITFSFENGVVVTLRTSGTEPKIKYYAEMCAKPEEKNWSQLRLTLSDMIQKIVEELLQPTENNLIARN